MVDFTHTRLRQAAIVAAVLAVVFCAWYPAIQAHANEQVEAGLKRALVSFASARALNAIISVVQGTAIAVQPFGVGVTLTPGQVLEPINDLVEHFASLMLAASVAFGIQKILLAVGGHWLVSAVVSGVTVIWAALAWARRAPGWLSRFVLVLLMIRFAIPVVTLGSEFIFQQVMAQPYVEHQAALEVARRDVESRAPKAAPPKVDASAGLLDKISGAVREHLNELPNVDFAAMKQSVEQVPERIVTVIGIFMAQTIVIPIVLLWALYRLVFGFVGLRAPARPARPWR